MAKMRLFGEPGWGSAIVEAQLDWYGLPYDYERVGNLFEEEEGRRKLAAVNPLVQVPTLLLADGTVLTESAAITLYLAETTGEDALVPNAGAALRLPFLRWLVFLVSNVYPTYTYGDEPARFVDGKEAQKSLREHVDEFAKKRYAVLESAAAAPWFLGERFSALDIYACVMTRWRPGREWFAANTPNLTAIAERTERVPQLLPWWERNRPPE